MLSWVIQITVISFILIFLVHHLINFFKSTLTVPKIKDLVNSPNQKYQNIYDTILHSSNSYTSIDLLPSESIQSENTNMKDELKSFLKKQLNSSNQNNSIMGIDSLSGTFSTF